MLCPKVGVLTELALRSNGFDFAQPTFLLESLKKYLDLVSLPDKTSSHQWTL